MASSNRARRVMKEIEDLSKDKQSNVKVVFATAAEDISALKGIIAGPPSTPYEGGTYEIQITIPADYPFRPPQMKFITSIWHPNISSQTHMLTELGINKGAICLDTLDKNWSPVLNLRSTLLSLQSLLESPEPKDPQDAEVATMYIHNYDAFYTKANDWAVRFAGAPRQQPRSSTAAPVKPPSNAKKDVDSRRYQGYNKNMVDRFVNMGFDIDKVVEAFIFFGIDRNGGEDYTMEEAYMGDVTARLLGEP